LANAASALNKRFGLDLPIHPVLNDPLAVRLLSRRTCRKYEGRQVPLSLLEALLNVAFSASSKSDFQQASVIIIRDPEQRRKIADLAPAMPWIGEAPAFIVFCADASRLETVCTMHGRSVDNRNLEALFNATIDAALVMQTFVIMAEQIGLGCCPISVIRNSLSKLSEILALPQRVIPIAGLCIGFPAGVDKISMRLSSEVTRFVDSYRQPEGVVPAIESYDQRRAQQEPTERNQQRAPDKFGYPECYGWSEDKSRQLQGGEGKLFGSMVRERGFLLD
jgi:FMN reductase [NAD(P)H]